MSIVRNNQVFEMPFGDYKPEGPQKTNAAVTTAAVTPAAIKIFSPSMSLGFSAENQMQLQYLFDFTSSAIDGIFLKHWFFQLCLSPFCSKFFYSFFSHCQHDWRNKVMCEFWRARSTNTDNIYHLKKKNINSEMSKQWNECVQCIYALRSFNLFESKTAAFSSLNRCRFSVIQILLFLYRFCCVFIHYSKQCKMLLFKNEKKKYQINFPGDFVCRSTIWFGFSWFSSHFFRSSRKSNPLPSNFYQIELCKKTKSEMLIKISD